MDFLTLNSPSLIHSCSLVAVSLISFTTVTIVLITINCNFSVTALSVHALYHSGLVRLPCDKHAKIQLSNKKTRDSSSSVT